MEAPRSSSRNEREEEEDGAAANPTGAIARTRRPLRSVEEGVSASSSSWVIVWMGWTTTFKRCSEEGDGAIPP